MEQNNPLFIAFQQGYARRNSNNFSRDWDEFKTNHADLFQPPSLAKPSVNGELLGFLEIEIEKANKNGKACNLKDGDFNMALAWYSAAEAFSIVKNKITELLNTPHGHQSSIINCPSCNTVWDLSRHNSCQCGATLVTKASPAKAEQEEERILRNGLEALQTAINGVDAILLEYCRDSNLHNVPDGRCDLLNHLLTGPKREQEGLRWVKATMFNYKPNSRYYARWGDGDGAIKSTGWFQQSDGTFFWNENGFVPVLKKEHDQLYILDESTTPPVKEVAYDELWDEFSEYIDDDIDSLSTFAGRTVLTEAQYNKLVAKLKAAPVNEAGQPAGESAQYEILTEMHNKESFFRVENDETGFYLSIIDRSKYPRIWADNLQSGTVAIIAESADNLINRTISSEQDWIDRFHGATIQECFRQYEQSQNNKP